MVYVINRHNKPLMPTKRHDRVRILLKQGLAVPVCNNPFTIKLKYDTPDVVQSLTMGIDPGRENIGYGVSKENGECVLLGELKTNNKSIKKNMDERRMHRRERRTNTRRRKQKKALRDNTAIKAGNDTTFRSKKSCKSKNISYSGMEKHIECKVIRGAESQFSNRKIPDGWLTPSARQLIQMYFRMIESVRKFLPISKIIIERNSFDFQKLENQDIKAWQYSKGPLYGYKDYKEYIYEQQHGKCLLCNKKIENYHHIIPLSKGGSDTVKNIAGLCCECHTGKNGVHNNVGTAEKLKNIKEGIAKKYQVSLLNTIMPKLIEELTIYCTREGISFALTGGYETYKFREKHSLQKEHYIDGYVISLSDREAENIIFTDCVYTQQRFKKKSAANIQKLNFRGYYILQNNKEILVAKNRRKATGQQEDSLEEYMADYSLVHTAEECEQHLKSLIVKPAKRTYLAHKYGLWSNIHVGDTVKYEKHNKIKGNTKQMVFIATKVSVLLSRIEHGTKSKQIKYCRTISHGCIPYIKREHI